MKTILDTPDLKLKHPEIISGMKVILKYLSDYYNENSYFPEIRKNNFEDLNTEDKALLNFDYKKRYDDIVNCMKDNQEVLNKLIKYYKDKYLSDDNKPANENDWKISKVGPLNYHACWFLVRDWTKEGENTRKGQYGPILDVINSLFIQNKTESEIKNTKILIPGAGLCRLVYELAIRGFTVEANDYSFLNLLIDNYFFNVIQKENQGHFYPMVHSFSCLMNSKGPSKRYEFPDVNIGKTLKEKNVDNLTLSYGDFVSLYSVRPNEFDIAITVFFLDSARNILSWIRAIQKTLKKGGMWINFGPLDYESASNYAEQCIELTWEDIKDSMEKAGFEFKTIEFREHAYCHIEGEIRKTIYDCIFFTAIKK